MAKYLITGGGFGNNGAESMLYSLITEIRRKDNDSEITIICASGYDKETESKLNNIKIIEEDVKTRLKILNPFTYTINKIFNKRSEILTAFQNCDYVFDVTGLGLTSKWGRNTNRRLLTTVSLAKKFNKKVILFPQSFGPFDYTKKQKITKTMIKNVLKKADLIFAREKEGYDLLKSLGLNNVELSSDVVIQDKGDYNGIYKEDIVADLDVQDNTVLIIPSYVVFGMVDNKKLLNLYKNAINRLSDLGYKIVISYYDNNDIEFAQQIFETVKDNTNVKFIDKKLNCIEYSQILSKFTFVITSRFHSAVHSYKKITPCMVIGWAVKYKELTESVNQQDYLFDCRNNLDENLFMDKLNYLVNNIHDEKAKISAGISKIQENNCFNRVWEELSNDR